MKLCYGPLTDVAAILNTIYNLCILETFYINFRINRSVNNLARTSRRRINKIMSRSPGQALLSQPYDRQREWRKKTPMRRTSLWSIMCQRHETWLRLLWNIMMAVSSCHAWFYLSLLEKINWNGLKPDQSIDAFANPRLQKILQLNPSLSGFLIKIFSQNDRADEAAPRHTMRDANLNIKKQQNKILIRFRWDVISDSVWCSWSEERGSSSRWWSEPGILLYAVLNSCFSSRAALQTKHNEKK